MKKLDFRTVMTVTFGICLASVFITLLMNAPRIFAYVGSILQALAPVLYGMVLAYLLCPITKKIEQKFSANRAVSVALTIAVTVILVVLFTFMVIPQLVNGIADLVNRLPGLIENALKVLEDYLVTSGQDPTSLMEWVKDIETYLSNWLSDNILTAVNQASKSIFSIGNFIVKLMMTVMVTIYLLLDRERYLAQVKKFFFAVCPSERWQQWMLQAAKKTNEIFSGFISGKVLDSVIVGVICFIGLTLLRMPYVLLISVVVGVTNVIPMIGPLIGAIPSAFLILLISPVKCLIFIVFITLLQQVDGNIIGPKILGNTTGLSSFYVVVAMLLFGKLLGFAGMVVGVPLFATIYYLVKEVVNYSLARQGKSTRTKDYI